MKVVVLIGSVRKNRVGERVGKFISAQAREHGLEVTTVDPQVAEFPLFTDHYAKLADGEKTNEMQKVAQAFDAADGFIFVSAEYNLSIPPALSNIVDYFNPEFKRKPVAVVTYSAGPFGGRGVQAQLPGLIAGVGGVPVPVRMPIPVAHETLKEDGTPNNEQMYDFSANFFNEFKWYLTALRNAK